MTEAVGVDKRDTAGGKRAPGKHRLDTAERELREARARVRGLLRLVLGNGATAPDAVPLCQAC